MKATSISTDCRIIPRRTRKNTFAPLLARLPIPQPKPAIFDPVTVVVALTGVTVPAVKAPSTRLPLLRNPRLVFIVFPPQVGALVGNASSCLWILRCEQVPSAGDDWSSCRADNNVVVQVRKTCFVSARIIKPEDPLCLYPRQFRRCVYHMI